MNTDNNSSYSQKPTGWFKKISPFLGVILLIVSVSAYTFYVKSELEDYKKIKSEVLVKTEKMEKIKKQINSYKETEKKMDLTTEVQKNTLISAIPVGINQDGLIEDLVKIAEENDIKLKSVSFGVSQGGKDAVGSIKMNASFEGSYGDLISFLKGIEENARFFKVNSISVQVSNVLGIDIKRVTFSLVLEAYYQ